MTRYILAIFVFVFAAYHGVLAQTGGNIFEATNEGGFYSDPHGACIESHQSQPANSGLIPTIFSTTYNDVGGIKAVWCKYDNGGSGYWGTDGSAFLRCPSGEAPTGDHRGCGKAEESDGVGTCNASAGGSPANAFGNPIDVSSGTKIQIETDFSAGDGRLHFTRTYRSIGMAASALGSNWSSNFHPQVNGVRHGWKGHFNIVLENGRIMRFMQTQNNWLPPSRPWSGYPTWVSKENHDRDDVQFKLIENSSTELELHHPNGRIQTFQFPGSGQPGPKLVEDSWPDGYSITFNYGTAGTLDDVTDSFSNTITFTYDSNRRLESATDPDGNVFKYTHKVHNWLSYVTGIHNIEEVIMPDDTPGTDNDNPRRQYLYQNGNWRGYMTGLIDERGIQTSTWTYGNNFRAESSEGPNGTRSYTVVNNELADSVTVTNPLGKETVYNYTRYRGLRKLATVDGVASSQCLASAKSHSYNSSGQLTQTVDREGQTTSISPNTATGLPNSITEGVGSGAAATTTFTWDSAIRKPTQIERGGLRTGFAYDSNANLQTLTLTDTTSHTVPYSTAGSQRVWVYTWQANGLLSSIDGPLPGAGDTTSFTYDSSGFLASVTDTNGHTTTITSVNGNGQPLGFTDANGLVTTLSYTPRGWLSSVNAGGETTTLTYDDAGHLTRTDFPTGGWVTYTYNDAGWVTASSSSEGESVSYTYDNMGNMLTRTVSGSGSFAQLSSTYGYDELGRLRSMLGGAGDTVSYAYDRADRQTSVQDGAGRSWLSAFDALDRVISVTDPEADVVGTAWNDNDELTAFTDANSYQTSFVRNGFGDVIREVSPDTGITDFWYDAAGNITKVVDASGREVNYAYDSGSRVISETYPADASLNFSYSYDSTSAGNAGKGRLTSINGATVDHAYSYDAHGRLLTETLSVGTQTYLTQYGYSAAGILETVVLPSGRELHYTNDTRGRITSVSTKASSSATMEAVASSIQWTAYGPIDSYSLANGTDAEYTYDASYRLGYISLSSGGTALLEKSYTRNNTGRVAWIMDTVDPTAAASFTYTDDGRIETATGLWGDFDWTYDGVGNRLTETEHFSGAPSETETYLYASSNNRLLDVEDGASNPLRDFLYEANGDLLTDVRTGVGTFLYSYGQDGRLASVQNGSTITATYAYDAFERRVLRTDAGGTMHFVFNPDGTLLGEYDASGSVIREYVWLDGMLIASFDALGTPTFVQTGHLGQPLLFTDGTGSVIWRGEITPWGDVVHISGSANSNDLRLPGQWAEAGSGLSQNWHRDYDPSTGRYIEADPLGIAAGQSVYGYVLQDPLNLIDPEGLQVWNWSRPGPSYDINDKNTTSEWRRRPRGEEQLQTNIRKANDALGEVAIFAGSFYVGAPGVCRAANFAIKGKEWKVSNDLRIAFFGNRTGHPTGRFPHYHRRGRIDPETGQPAHGQGIGRHRPWDTRQPRRGEPPERFRDRF
ncbi:MAG: RHS repeat-associated core domain-containing protein [Pseudomonadota bacterium]